MKTTVAIESFEELKARKLARAKKLVRREHVPAEKRITFPDIEDFLSCVTPKRVELCEVVRKRPCSVSDLATLLHRDRKSVHRDVQALHAAGMLNLRDEVNPGHGRVVIVEATAQKFRLMAEI